MRTRAGICLVLGALLAAVGGCGSYAKSGSGAPSSTNGTFGSLPPLEALTGITTTTKVRPRPTTTVKGAAPATTAPVSAGTTPPTAPPGTRQSAIDAQPCAHPTDRHAVDRTDPEGLFMRIGALKNCVGLNDTIEVVVQIGNPTQSTLYVSSASPVLVSFLGAAGKPQWSSPCEVKPPPPGGPPDVPIPIEKGKSVEMARRVYDKKTSECGELGPGRYEAQASVAQCTAEDAKDGVCDTPKRIPTERIGIEVRPS